MNIAIVTTRHWPGDARLQRHQRYLEAVGHSVTLHSSSSLGRMRSIWSGMRTVMRVSAEAVILPDPEFFAIGGLLARVRGIRPVIDVHEDYPKTASSRSWIPRAIRPVASAVARALIDLGRLVAWRVVVAAPQLSRGNDIVVLNTADPSDFDASIDKSSNAVVYVGDLTAARGVNEMLETLSLLPVDFELTLIGPIDQSTRENVEMAALALDVADRLRVVGRLEHADAWNQAARAQFGLSLLHDVPAYRDAVATKLWEYMAAGIIPLVSALPGQIRLISSLSPDLVCDTPEAVAETIVRLADDPETRSRLMDRGRATAQTEWDRARPDLRIQGVFEP